ncbi:MAG: hypothetical protein JNK60_16515, partial [Acidobacteria bacterium]|nr:hypothetical protein [Acidobacteriota bacterium]
TGGPTKIVEPALPGTDPRPGGSPLSLPVNPPRPEPTPAVSALEAAEQQWRSRADAARADLAAAEAELARVEASMDGGAGMGISASDQQAAQIRQNRTASARNRVESARARLDGLAEECRRSAGCAPGWVR